MYLDQFPYTETVEPHTYTFHAKCDMCERPIDITLPSQGLFDYRQGKHVQDAFPELSDDDREMIITGICGECWANLFGEE